MGAQLWFGARVEPYEFVKPRKAVKPSSAVALETAKRSALYGASSRTARARTTSTDLGRPDHDRE
jgi:hypothetical protein